MIHVGIFKLFKLLLENILLNILFLVNCLEGPLIAIAPSRINFLHLSYNEKIFDRCSQKENDSEKA